MPSRAGLRHEIVRVGLAAGAPSSVSMSATRCGVQASTCTCLPTAAPKLLAAIWRFDES
jgi:hypothetical protein